MMPHVLLAVGLLMGFCALVGYSCIRVGALRDDEWD
ncbi:hypothetical protein HMPREF1008_00279 [Olsenella sp. oral taxon 809 str. F0356]|nr:hypothetical protein HMPREF1008_00279 [Olsenella sp. oral taxon 809 str. F0356]